ncbi:hypothetical protein [Kitasatospora griseola]|uniref:hypothetical protein n=1 Tax=Kitasatospora griseola TaxID=2064 RepID=UPI000A51C4CA|nr:hypothetical protein [Kitasatospora griseola]
MRISRTAPRRILSAGIAVAALGAGTLVLGGAARANSQPVTFQLKDIVILPGESDRALSPGGIYGRADGTWVYAVSSKPLTDAGASLGLPDGVSVKVGVPGPSSSCAAATGTAGVYTCDVVSTSSPFASPVIGASEAAHDGTVAYYGAVFVPRGGDVAAAVTRVKTVGSSPANGPTSEQAAKVTVETSDHVARNTVRLTTPDLAAGKSVTQQVAVHAVDPGKLQLLFNSAAGQPSWPTFPTPVGVKVTDSTATPAGTCNHVTSDLNSPTTIVWCDLPAGDSTISYTLAAQPEMASWKVDVRAEYQVLTWGAGNPVANSTFALQGTAPEPSGSPTASPTASPTQTPTDPATTPAPVVTTSQPSTPTPTPTGSPAGTAAPVVPHPGNTGGTLASTGTDNLAPAVGGGLALIAGGALALVALHRRRASHR